MKITLTIDGEPRRDIVGLPFPNYAVFAGQCPKCKSEPFQVSGRELHVVNDREYHSDGYCRACGQPVGKIIAAPDTLFGIAEDERVLHGRCRVY